MSGEMVRKMMVRVAMVGLVALGIAVASGALGSAPALAQSDSGLYRADKTTRYFAAPDLNAQVLGRVSKGTVVAALGPAEGCGAESCAWGKIAFDGHEGWVVTKYFEAALPVDGTATANVAVNLRTGPGVHRRIERVIPAGGEMTLTGEQKNGFVSVEYDGTAGWVSGDSLTFFPAPQF